MYTQRKRRELGCRHNQRGEKIIIIYEAPWDSCLVLKILPLTINGPVWDYFYGKF